MQNLFAITALLASVIWCQEFTLTAIVTGVQTIKSCGLEETGCPGHSSIAVTPTRIVTQEPQLTSTALVTDIETITSCLPEVVNCPLLTKTSTLTPATTILVPSITTGAVIFQNGTACSVYEATTITLPCSSCAIISSTLALSVITPVEHATIVTVTQPFCPSTSSILSANLGLDTYQTDDHSTASVTDFATPKFSSLEATTALTDFSLANSTSASAATDSGAPKHASSIVGGTGAAPNASHTSAYSGIPFLSHAGKGGLTSFWTAGAFSAIALTFALF